MSLGFFQIQRQIMDHWTYKNIYSRSLWIHMLLVARYADEPHTESYNGHLITLNQGEFVFGRERWVKELEIPEQRMRTLLKKFVDADMVELRYTYPKGSVYLIKNYQKFNQRNNQQQPLEPQGIEADVNQQGNQQLTSNQPATNQKRIKKESNKVKKVKTKIEYAPSVELSEDEYSKLIIKYGGEEMLRKWLEYLSNKILANGYEKYKSHYHVMIGWVYDNFQKQANTSISKTNGNYSNKKSKQEEASEQLLRDIRGGLGEQNSSQTAFSYNQQLLP